MGNENNQVKASELHVYTNTSQSPLVFQANQRCPTHLFQNVHITQIRRCERSSRVEISGSDCALLFDTVIIRASNKDCSAATTITKDYSFSNIANNSLMDSTVIGWNDPNDVEDNSLCSCQHNEICVHDTSDNICEYGNKMVVPCATHWSYDCRNLSAHLEQVNVTQLLKPGQDSWMTVRQALDQNSYVTMERPITFCYVPPQSQTPTVIPNPVYYMDSPPKVNVSWVVTETFNPGMCDGRSKPILTYFDHGQTKQKRLISQVTEIQLSYYQPMEELQF
jgi:hypothetical protein